MENLRIKIDVDYLIAKYEAIPEHLIIHGRYENNDGGKCVVKWCDCDPFVRKITHEGSALIKAFEDLPITSIHTNGLITHKWRDGEVWPHKAENINEGCTKEYQQPTPKQRILAALRDAKALQEVRIENLLFDESETYCMYNGKLKD